MEESVKFPYLIGLNYMWSNVCKYLKLTWKRRARAKNGSAHVFENRFFIFVCLGSMGYVDGSGNPEFTKIAVICPLICKISVL